MNIYEINASGQPALPVFADSYDQAASIYMVYWVTTHKADLPDLEVKLRNPSWAGMDVALLATALDRGVSGIGRLDPDLGWVILPADDGDEVQA